MAVTTFVKAALSILVARTLAVRNKLQAQQTTNELVQTIGALLQNSNDDEMLSKFQALAQATPGAHASLESAIDAVIQDIDDDVISKIVAGHTNAQTELTNIIQDLHRSSNSASLQKAVANSKDKEWFECVDAEKDEMVKVEQAKEDLRQAISNVVTPCQDRDASSAFSSVPSQATFSCDFSVDGSCTQQQQNYMTQMNALIAAVESDMTTKREIFTAFDTDCKAKQALREQAHSALQNASTTWKNQQETCLTKHEDRQLSVCLYGSKLKHKCERYNKYNILTFEIDTPTQDDVPGSVYSHPDRVHEWRTAAMTKCMLKKVRDELSIDAAALTDCTDSLNFDVAVGVLNKYDTLIASLSEGCSQAPVTFFNGEEWSVPTGDSPASSEYVLQPFKPEFRESDDFPFCSHRKRSKFHYVGCFTDQRARSLPHFEGAFGNTRETCNAKCSNYKYFGLQFFGQCFCGDGPDKGVSATESSCNTPCLADPETKCGGGWRNAVYTTSTTPTEIE